MTSTPSFIPEAKMSICTVLDTFLKLDKSKQEALRAKVAVAVNPAESSTKRQEAERAILATLRLSGVPDSPPRRVSEEEFLSREQLTRLAQMEQEESVFAERLSRLMAEKQMTQAELARRIGVGQSAVSMLLSRKCRPQPRTLGKLAEALGVTVSEIWPGKVGL